MSEPTPGRTPSRSCTCAEDGSAFRCSFHKQADFESARPRCGCCSGLMNGEPGYICGPCHYMGCIWKPEIVEDPDLAPGTFMLVQDGVPLGVGIVPEEASDA